MFSKIFEHFEKYLQHLFISSFNQLSVKGCLSARGRLVETDGDFVLKLIGFSIDSRKEKGYQMGFDCTSNSKITDSINNAMKQTHASGLPQVMINFLINTLPDQEAE